MSKIKLQGNASGTGILTIESPNTDTDRTLTLPDGAGEILTNATGLTSSSSLNAANLTGTLPAIDGSSLTGLEGGAWEIVETWTPTAVNSKDFTLDSDTYNAYKFVVDAAPDNGAANIFLNLTFRADGGSTAVDNINYRSMEGLDTTTWTQTAAATSFQLTRAYGTENISGSDDIYTSVFGILNIQYQNKPINVSTGAYAAYGTMLFTLGDARFSSNLVGTSNLEAPEDDRFIFNARANTATDKNIDTVRFYWDSTYTFKAGVGSIILYGLKRS